MEQPQSKWATPERRQYQRKRSANFVAQNKCGRCGRSKEDLTSYRCDTCKMVHKQESTEKRKRDAISKWKG